MAIDFEEMAALVEMLKQLEFADFRFEKGDLSISVRRGELLADEPANLPTAQVDPTVENATPVKLPASLDAAGLTATATPPAESSHGEGDHIVTAPLLGVIYGAPKPGEPAFVTIGTRVKSGDTVCVIEVMKLYNSITASVSGIVTARFAEDGQLVEFGQPLFAIRADK